MVWAVRAIFTSCPLVNSRGVAAEVAREVAEAAPRMGVTNVGLVEKTASPVPVSSESEPSKLAEVMESVLVPYKVPEVGRVTEVLPVVKRERALLAEKVITSPPARVMALVPKVVESEAVRVLPAPSVKVPVPVVMVLPLKVAPVTAPVTAKAPVRVESPLTVKVVMLAVPVDKWLADRLVALNKVAPAKLVAGLGGMKPTLGAERAAELPASPLGPSGPMGPGSPCGPRSLSAISF